MSAEAEDDDNNMEVPVIAKDQAAHDAILKGVKNHSLFEGMKAIHIEKVIGAMQKLDTKPGVAVIKQGEKGAEASNFYVIESGSYMVSFPFKFAFCRITSIAVCQ